ncbi:MAG: nucleotidyltransferase [Bacilli bacterium]|nr:nucleotidyltransferase [Bacilli bacterium]
MKDKTLLILAAGMGSRFGGLKQAEKFGPNGEYIIDYSIYDAIRCGFNKVVFIIKEENYDLFRETVGKRIEGHIKVEYVFQNNDNVPEKYKIPEDRIKPLGTAHAVLCAKNAVNEPFVMINSDDFYGYDAFKVASEYLDNGNENSIAIVGYNVENTITETGAVKRGIMKELNGKLLEIVESSIEKQNDKIYATPLGTTNIKEISKDTKVSMNMITFLPDIFGFIEKNFEGFLKNSNLEKDEYLIPNIVMKAVDSNYCPVKVLNTTAKWVGVTYKEDKQSVTDYINMLIEKGEYKSNLWN